MKKLVDDVGGDQPPGVEDRRPSQVMVGEDADQTVPYPALLVADRQRGDPLQLDRVVAEAEFSLPAPQERVVS